MSNLRALKLSMPIVAAMASTATAQDNNDLNGDGIRDVYNNITDCRVNADGAEQITLENGDVIANQNWFHDSFQIGIAIEGEDDAVTISGADGESISIEVICNRDDIDPPEYPPFEPEEAYDYMCLEAGAFVDVFEVATGEIQLSVENINATFRVIAAGDITTDDDYVGVCEYEMDGVKRTAPIVSYAFYNSIP